MDLDAQWHSYVVPYKLPCIYIFWRYFSCNPEMFHASAPSLGFSRMKFDCNINLTLNISGVLDSIIVSLFDLGFFVAQYAENPRNSKKKVYVPSRVCHFAHPKALTGSAKRMCVEEPETGEKHTHMYVLMGNGARIFFYLQHDDHACITLQKFPLL